MTHNNLLEDRSYRRQLRVFLEELCAELCRFQHITEDGRVAESLRIRREVKVGPGSFVDVLVERSDKSAYAMEVKFGYPVETMLEQLQKKYGSHVSATNHIQRLVVLVRDADDSTKANLAAEVRNTIRQDLTLEIWTESDLLRRIELCFGVALDKIVTKDLHSVRRAINAKKWSTAFGESNCSRLSDMLLWHFGVWNLRRLNREQGLQPNRVLTPGLYHDVAIVMADLCSFSSYVRDTRDHELVRHSLTTFYSRARDAVHNTGGMLYQFVGDEVIGLFGIPDNASGYPDQAVDCACQLIDVGESVSCTWQKRLDRQQDKSGVHVGISVGDLNLLPLLPFSDTQIGFVGDAMNMAARLMSEAEPGRIVVSNSFYRLCSIYSKQFEEMPGIEAKNVGRIKCWQFRPRDGV